MYDLTIEIAPPWPVNDEAEKQAGDQEEVGHAERLGEGHDMMHPAFRACRLFHAQRGMHHDDEDNANTLGNIDPVDPLYSPGCPTHFIFSAPDIRTLYLNIDCKDILAECNRGF
ncbi:hypothetical protein D9M69_594560 [compost metagenome]